MGRSLGWLLRAGRALEIEQLTSTQVGHGVFWQFCKPSPFEDGTDASAQLSHPAGTWVMTFTEPSRECECAEFKRFRRSGESLKERAKFAWRVRVNTTPHAFRLCEDKTRVYKTSKRWGRQKNVIRSG